MGKLSEEQLSFNWGATFDDTRDEYNSFCRRQWLDHCDENKTGFSTSYTLEEYKSRFKDSLLDKFESE